MVFADSAVAEVFAEYQRRMAEEDVKAKTLGGAMLARRDEFLWATQSR